MKSLVVGLFSCFLATSAIAVPIQWTTTSGGNGHWYEVIDIPSDWNTARDDAVSRVWNNLQGYLVSITSAAENSFILNTLNPSQFGALWTGGTDVATEGVFTWVDGPEDGLIFRNGTLDTGFTSWFPGEPNNSGGEDYVEIGFFSTFWNDRPGAQPWSYIVEYGGVSANEPIVAPLPESGLLLMAGVGALFLSSRRKKAAR
ncbi:MAG: lectin-like protein [Paracoccaceae bacterium]